MEQTILIPSHRLRKGDLDRFRNNPFENMIKFAVDVRMERIALGGEMHADGEEALLLSGSNQADIWGGNLWPWGESPRIEYISLINIRPSVDNRGMDIQFDDIREAVRKVVYAWVELP
jgi:hypothetical protein